LVAGKGPFRPDPSPIAPGLPALPPSRISQRPQNELGPPRSMPPDSPDTPPDAYPVPLKAT